MKNFGEKKMYKRPPLELFSLENDEDAVSIGEGFRAQTFVDAQEPNLSFPLGKNSDGEIEVCSLSKTVHLLISGVDGSGKTSFLNSMIAGLTINNSPQDIRFLLIGCNDSDFSDYIGFSHSLSKKPFKGISQAIFSLNWAMGEIERRYSILKEAQQKNIINYNNLESVVNGIDERLPNIIIIIDEFSPIVQAKKEKFEDAVCNICLRGRSAGVFLVMTTRDASNNSITGKIYTSIASRIAFRLDTAEDSKRAVYMRGAEELTKCGEFIYSAVYEDEHKKINGCFITENETISLVKFLKKSTRRYRRNRNEYFISD